MVGQSFSVAFDWRDESVSNSAGSVKDVNGVSDVPQAGIQAVLLRLCLGV